MAKNLDNYLADRVLTRQLYLMRFSAGEQKKVLAVLVDMRAELGVPPNLMRAIAEHIKSEILEQIHA